MIKNMNKIIKFICSIFLIGTILSCSNQNNSSYSITMFKDNYDLKEHKSESTFEELTEFMNEKKSFYLNNFKNSPGSFEFISSYKTNQYLDEDLIGLNVIMNNKNYGKVTNIEHDRYQDKIVVNKDDTLYLVPYVCDIIKNINLEEGTITLEYIKGLLD